MKRDLDQRGVWPSKANYFKLALDNNQMKQG